MDTKSQDTKSQDTKSQKFIFSFMDMADAGSQTDKELLQPVFLEWIAHIMANIPPPQPTRLIPPEPEQGPITFAEWFEALTEDSYEVYDLKAKYEEAFNTHLSIYQFAGLKIIRQNFTKFSVNSQGQKQLIYQKRVG